MRVACVALSVALLAAAVGGPAAAAATLPSASPRLPVILVHGAGSGPGVWGVPNGQGRPGGLYAALVARGYVPGQTLYVLDYSDAADGDYVRVARERLGPLVERALEVSGAPKVDLVAHSMGALVARYYVTALGGSDRVRTVVMLAPPNRGARLAALYRLVGAVAEQERLRRTEGGGRGEVLDPGAVSGPFVDERSYLKRVSRDFFEPLYAQFVEEELFLRPIPEGGRPATFPSWLAARHPERYEDAFARANEPPLAGERDPEDPEPGAFLSRGYFHTLALAVARNNYRQLAPWALVALEDWEEDLVPSESLKDTVVRFLERRALRLLGEALRRYGLSAGRQALLAGGEALSGLSPGSHAVARLVREEEPVSWETADAGRVPANRWLARLNAREQAEAETRPVRYVIVLGEFPGTRGDLAVEAEDALLPPGPLDVYRLERGFLANHLSLARDRRLYPFILAELDPLAGARRARGAPAPGSPGTVQEGEDVVGPSAPVLIELQAGDGRAEASFLSAEVSPAGEPAPGLALRGYLLVARGGVVRRVEPLRAAGRDGALRGSLDLGGLDPADRVFLAVRLVPPVGGRPSPARLRAWVSQAFRYSVTMGAPGMSPGAARRAGGGRSAAQREGGDAGGTSRERGASPEAPRLDLRDRNDRGVPRVDVVYRNKRTTDRVEDRTYHVRWEWDFGDGTTWVDGDPSHIVSEVSHAFPPGTYTVRARSVSNKGTVLREVTWEVTVSAPGETIRLETGGGPFTGGGGPPPPVTDGGGWAVRTFRAETVREPVPRLVLHGPLKWITGRPARFRVEVEVPPVPFLDAVTVTLYPAREFDVVWARPGIFRVQAAAVVRATYRLPEGRLVLTNTYVVERKVDVLATSVTG